MPDDSFTQLAELSRSSEPEQTLDRLLECLENDGQYHRLFDARLLKKKYKLGLPLTRPTSFDDVPEEKRKEFEDEYINAARDVGNKLLADGQIGPAWVYFRTIQEPEAVRKALEAVDPENASAESTEEWIQVAVYDAAHPLRGFEIMLTAHGTCSTITAIDQHLPQLPAELRHQIAKLMVAHLYEDLRDSVAYDVKQREPEGEYDNLSLRELIDGRDQLFADSNYHTDVSHLSSVVRFGRALESGDKEMDLVRQLVEYGSRLAEQFQYGGDVPFDDYYPAHREFFRALADDERDKALAYFKKKLNTETDERDKQMIAYVLADMLTRIGRLPAAVEIASQYLSEIEDPNGFSFSDLCRKAGQYDTLRRVARSRDDLVMYTAGLLSEKPAEPAPAATS